MGGVDGLDVDDVKTGAAQCVPFWGPFAAGGVPIGLFDANRTRSIIMSNRLGAIAGLVYKPIVAMRQHLFVGEIHTPVYRHRHIDEQVSAHHTHVRDTQVDDYVCGHPVGTHNHREVHHSHNYGPVLRRTETELASVLHQPFAQTFHQQVIEHGIDRHVMQDRVYSIFETNTKMVLGGALGFLAIGPVALGVGAMANFKWDIRSHRKVLGREAAYDACELDPPSCLRDILQWQARFTDISWSQQRGIKLVAGLYSGGSVGVTQDIMGVWKHRVVRILEIDPRTGLDNEIISVTLSRQGRIRLDGVVGALPIAVKKKGLKNSAKLEEIQFSFKNIRNQPHLINILDQLIQGTDKSAVIKAKAIADHYVGIADAPIVFDREKVVEENRARDFSRLRIPALFRIQSENYTKDMIERHNVLIGGVKRSREYISTVVVVRKMRQKPLESSFRPEDERIYRQRVGVDINGKVKFPLDYKNSLYYELTKVYTIRQGSEVSPYSSTSAKYEWMIDKNYTSRENFIKNISRIGCKTGLLLLLFSSEDIPYFTGPTHRNRDCHESVRFTMDILLSSYDKNKVIKNISDEGFENAVVTLRNSYIKRDNYLNLSAAEIDTVLLRDNCRKIIQKASDLQDLKKNHRKKWFFDLFSRPATPKDIRRYEAQILHMLKASPFIFLSAFCGANPRVSSSMEGTSIPEQTRNIEISLARDIMLNRAAQPRYRTRIQSLDKFLQHDCMEPRSILQRNGAADEGGRQSQILMAADIPPPPSPAVLFSERYTQPRSVIPRVAYPVTRSYHPSGMQPTRIGVVATSRILAPGPATIRHK